jgi:hypothetical protein
MSKELSQTGILCEYGCKREAKWSLRTKGGGWKVCCCANYQACPAQKLKRGAITRAVHARQTIEGVVLRRSFLRQYKRMAVERGIKWTITDNHFYNLIRGLCYYCGWQPVAMQQFNGVDRFEESLGYTPQNSVPICTGCEAIRHEFPDTEALWKHVKRILDRHPGGIVHPSKAVITKSA